VGGGIPGPLLGPPVDKLAARVVAAGSDPMRAGPPKEMYVVADTVIDKRSPADADSAASPESSGRVQSYDIYRGLLLTAMVVYHVVANLTPLRFDLRYSYWIPMGFVLFLGVVLARFLRNKTRKKLWLAVKVLAAFFLLNIPKYLDADFTLARLARGDLYYFSFEVLLPMGLLVLASVFLDRTRRVAYALTAVTFASIVYLNLTGFDSYNLSFLLYGLVGYFLALRLDLHALAITQRGWYAVPLVLVSALPFALLGLGYFLDYLFVLQVIACYFLVTRLIPRSRVLGFVGRHSFVIYIAHIIAIKIIMYLTGW
jgi:uncharacterized membrane protein